MRNISFSATTEQVRNRQKFVTRRLIHPGKRSIWQNLKPDEHLMGIEKGQGLKKGEKVKRITEIVVLDAPTEPLMDIIRRPIRHPKDPREWVCIFKVCPYQDVPREKRGLCGGVCLVGKCRNPNNLSDDCDPVACPGLPETILEGFPKMPPHDFVKMFMKMNDCTQDAPVVRNLFDYIDPVKGGLVAQ